MHCYKKEVICKTDKSEEGKIFHARGQIALLRKVFPAPLSGVEIMFIITVFMRA